MECLLQIMTVSCDSGMKWTLLLSVGDLRIVVPPRHPVLSGFHSTRAALFDVGMETMSTLSIGKMMAERSKKSPIRNILISRETLILLLVDKPITFSQELHGHRSQFLAPLSVGSQMFLLSVIRDNHYT